MNLHSIRLFFVWFYCLSTFSFSFADESCKKKGNSYLLHLNSQNYCPLTDRSEQSDIKNVKEHYNKLARDILKENPWVESIEKMSSEDCETPGATCSLYFDTKISFNIARGSENYKKLSFEEVFAIFNYVEWGHQSINGALYSGKSQQKNILSDIKVLQDGLKKIPIHEGVVYRGEIHPLSKNGLKELEVRIARYLGDSTPQNPRPGQKVFFKGFTSTTKGLNDQARNAYINGRMISMKLKVRSGRYIEPLSSRPWEEEVLLPAGTWFKVTKIEKISRTPSRSYPHDFQWKVELEEI